MREVFPVVIVGGGPVGMALAVDLGLRGVECVVVERHREPQHIPKGQNLTQRTMEHFAFWGIEDDVRAARKMPHGYPNSGVVAYGNLMSEYSYPWWKRSMVADFYARANERVPQYETERVLRERAAGLEGVTVLYDWSGVGVIGNTVQVVSDTGTRRELQGEFVVGCDGSRSTVREGAGIPEIVSDHDRRMVLIVFRSFDLHQVLGRFGEASIFNIMDPALDGYWRFLGRVDGDGEFFFHAPVPPDATADNHDFAELLHESVGTEFAIDFEHIGFWDLRFAVADPYRAGPVFVAGDAAHSHPPYGGYGINTGFEDARNLAWKLTAWFEGWGSEALLDSYDAERRPVFRSTASDFIEKMIDAGRAFLATHDPEVDRDDFEEAWERRSQRSSMGVTDFEPHYEGSPIVAAPGTPGAVGSHEYFARAGHHLPPSGDLFEELGSSFTLLADRGTDVSGFTSGHSRIPLQVVRGDLTDYDASLILVRPDHFVSWVGDDADATVAGEVLSRSAGG